MGLKKFGFSSSIVEITLFKEYRLGFKPPSQLEEEEEKKIKEVLWV